jgi:hypothetical protein
MLNEDTIHKVLKQKHGVLIGEHTAEELLLELKHQLAEIKLPVKGRSVASGLHQTVEVTAAELLEIS